MTPGPRPGPAEAAAVGQHALQFADDTRSSLIVDWLIRFDDQLGTYVRTAAPTRVGDL
jgi:hypothetical protein